MIQTSHKKSTTPVVVRTEFFKPSDKKFNWYSSKELVKYLSDKTTEADMDVCKTNLNYKDYVFSNKNGLAEKRNILNNLSDDPKEFSDNLKDHDSIIYSMIISFDADFAGEHDLWNKTTVEKAISDQLLRVISEKKFHRASTDVLVAFHTDTDNPHVHVVFAQNKKRCKEYGHDYVEYEKNWTSNNTKSTMIPKNVLVDMRFEIGKEASNLTQDYSNIAAQRKLLRKDIAKKINDKKSRSVDLHESLLKFSKRLPEKGRTQYNSSNMRRHRRSIDNIVKKHIILNDNFGNEYTKTIKSINLVGDKINYLSANKQMGTIWKRKNTEEMNAQIGQMIINEAIKLQKMERASSFNYTPTHKSKKMKPRNLYRMSAFKKMNSLLENLGRSQLSFLRQKEQEMRNFSKNMKDAEYEKL